MELELTLSPVDVNQAAALPAQGCVVAKPNYGRGNNGGDDKSCALLRWGSSDGAASGTTDLFNQIFGNDPNAPSTMVSVSGTVYAPAAAVDIAEYGRYCQQTRKNRFLWWVWDACDGTNANAFSGVNYPVVDRGIVAGRFGSGASRSTLSTRTTSSDAAATIAETRRCPTRSS